MKTIRLIECGDNVTIEFEHGGEDPYSNSLEALTNLFLEKGYTVEQHYIDRDFNQQLSKVLAAKPVKKVQLINDQGGCLIKDGLNKVMFLGIYHIENYFKPLYESLGYEVEILDNNGCESLFADNNN